MALTKVQIKEILAKNQITLEDMEAVASSPKLKGFDSIDLSGKGITDDIGLVLICSKHLGGLLKLNLSNNNLTNDFVKILLKPEVLSNLLKLNLRSNQVTSHVISDLINKYNKALNASPYGDDITTICGISICSSGYSDIPRWVKLADRVQEEYDDCCIMDFEQIVDFIDKNAIPSDFEEESGFEKPFKKAFKLLNDRTYDRCIGGAMAGSDSLVVNKLYAVEDFFYLEHSMEGDKVFEFEKEAFEEADRLESLYEEEDDDDEDDDNDDDEDDEDDEDEDEDEDESTYEDYTKAIELDPKYAHAYFNRGFAYDELKKYEEAIADYTKAMELDPKDSDAYSNRGHAYRNLEKYEKAIADYTKAIDLDPKDSDAYNGRGFTYDELKKYEEAIADYTKAIELDPKDGLAYNNRGFVYFDQKKYSDAEEDFTTAIKIYKTDDAAEPYFGRILSYFHLEKFSEAAADFEKAKDLVPKYADAFYYRGLVNHQFKKYQEAITDFNSATEFNPKNPNPKYYTARGLTYKILGKTKESEADFAKAKELEK